MTGVIASGLVLLTPGVAQASGALEATPTSLTFAPAEPGVAAPPLDVAISNSGPDPVAISSVGVSASGAQDFAETDSCAGKTLAAGQNCGVTVTFTPYTSGVRTGVLTITPSDTTPPLNVPLSGQGQPKPESGMITFASGRNGGPYGHIFVMAADGSNVLDLTEASGAPCGCDDFPSFRPDGSRIAFERAPSSLGGGNIWAVNPDGSGATQLTSSGSDHMPAWSPDGSQIAYMSVANGINQIWISDADGSNPHAISPDLNGGFGRPEWSPDGSKLVYEAVVGPQLQVFTINADGTGAAQLTSFTTGDTLRAAWSPDGQTIAFMHEAGNTWHIWTIHPDGTGLNDTGATGQTPAWSPDGSKIIFTSAAPPFTSPSFLEIMNVDGTGVTVLDPTNTARDDHGPSWVDNLLLTATESTVNANPPSIPFNSLSTSGASPAKVAGSPIQLPGGLPIQLPGGLQIQLPGGLPIQLPGGLPIQLPGGLQIQLPGGLPILKPDGSPIQLPGGLPIQLPGGLQIQLPGGLPIQLPGGLPIQLPGGLRAVLPNAFTVTLADGSQIQLPGGLPLTFPDGTQIQLPGGLPIQLPGGLPIQLPGGLPIQLPGGLPIQLPGGLPLTLGDPSIGLPSLVSATDLGSSASVVAGLNHVSLASLPTTASGGWAQVLDGTSLAGLPLQEVSLYDVLKANVTLPAVNTIDFSQGPLGRIGLASFLLGGTRLRDIHVANPDPNDTRSGWCYYLEHAGHANCGADLGVANAPDQGLSASLLSLQIAGLSLDDFPVVLKMSDMTLTEGHAPLLDVQLRQLDLGHASLGNLPLASLPGTQTAVDCSVAGVDCSSTSTQTLYHVSGQDPTGPDALEQDASIGSLGSATAGLTYAEILYGIAGDGPWDPYENISLNQLGAYGYGQGATNPIHYHVQYSPVGVASVTNPTITVNLPADFRIAPSSSTWCFGPASSIVCSETGGAKTVSDPTEAVSADGTTMAATFSIPATVTTGALLTVDFVGVPGLTLGTHDASATITSDNVTQSVQHRAPVNVVENFEDAGAKTPGSAPIIQPGSMYFSQIANAGDIDYFRLPAPPQPGSTITVILDHLSYDADLVLYHPASAKPSQPLRPAGNLPAITGTSDQAVGLSMAGEQLDPQSLNDVPLASLPIAGESDNRGLQHESIQALSWSANPGDYYTIQVHGYNGAHGPQPYALRVIVTPPTAIPAAGARILPNPPSGVAPTLPTIDPNTTYRTLILTNEQRLQQLYGDAGHQTALHALQTLADDPTVAGLIVPVDAWNDVNDAYAAWDAQPDNPDLANDVVRTINTDIDALLGPARANLTHLVIAGTDEVIPMARVPDLTQSFNERGFAQELLARLGPTSPGGSNALIGAAAHGDILTDDGYAAFSPRAFLGTWIYAPNVATGRLVETPDDMAAVVNQFETPTNPGDPSGLLRPSSSLTTGYDFMTSMAQAINTSLQAQLDHSETSLIGENWTRADFESAYLQANPTPDIAAINAHFNPIELLPAAHPDGSADTVTTDEFAPATGGPDLVKRLLFTIGCHSGFSVSDYLAGSAGFKDFPQATLARGAAAFVGQTGYGLATYAPTIGFSEQLMLGFVQNIPTMTLGQALAQAKQTYLSVNPNVYDYKALAESTFYGLPMFRVASSAVAPPPPPPPTVRTDTITHLASASVSLSNPATSSNWQLTSSTNPDGSSNGSYYQLAGQPGSGNDGRQSISAYAPIEPRVDLDVTAAPDSGLVASGMVITSLSSVDQYNFDPVLARPVVDSTGAEPEVQFGTVSYPSALQSMGNYQSLTSGDRQTVSLVPAQFTSASPIGDSSTTIGRERRFTNIAGTVYYRDASDTNTTPPTILQTTATNVSGANLTFAADVAGANGAAIKRVVVMYHDATASSGDWSEIDLAPSAGNQWTGAVSSTLGQVEYMIQAVDADANVGISTNKGVYFPAVTPTAASTGNLQWSAPAPITYGTPIGASELNATADVPGTFTYSPAAGTVLGAGQHRLTVAFTPQDQTLAPSSASVTLTVNPAALTVTADNKSMAYGDPVPQLTSSIAGFVNGDNASVVSGAASLSTAATSSSPAGSYPITVDASSLSAANYVFHGSNGTLTIGTRILTVRADPQTKAYGQPNPPLTFTWVGFANGDGPGSVTGTPGLATSATTSSGVGTYPITVDVSQLSATNYTFLGQNSTLTVTRAVLTVSADGKTKVYGQPNPTLTSTITGYVNGDGASVVSGTPTLTTTAATGSGVGTYPISVSTSGMSAANYTIAAAAGTLTVNPAVLTVIADGKSKVYGQPNPAFTSSIAGFVNGDTASVVSGVPVLATSASASSGVGAYAITADTSHMSAANYTFASQSGMLTVTQAVLTVAASPATKTYGQPNPNFGYTFTGFVNGDTSNVVSGAPALSTSATQSSPVGSYAITVDTSGMSSTNYLFSAQSGVITVSRATLTVAADAKSKTYGQLNPALTFTITGFVNGDTSSVISGAPTLSTTAGTGSAIGPYLITVNTSGMSATNYVFSGQSGTLTINPALLTVTANSLSMYYGQPVPTLTYAFSGFVNGDTSSVVAGAPVLTTAASSTSSPGSYAITITAGSLAASNYTFTTAPGTMTVLKAPTKLVAKPAKVSSSTVSIPLSATLTTNIAGVSAGPIPGQTVTFTLSPTVPGASCTAVTDSSGVASCSVAVTNAALFHSYTAVFSATTNYVASSGSASVSVV